MRGQPALVRALGARLGWGLAGVLCTAGSGRAQEWTRCLDVRQGPSALTVCFGVRPEATDAIDPGLEAEFPPPAPAGVLQAVFTGPGLGNGVAVDLRSNAPATHELTLRLAWSGGEPLTLSWSAGDIAAATTLARLRDGFGGALGIDVDMAVEGSLVLTRPLITTLVLLFESRRVVEEQRRFLRFATQPSGTISGQPLTTQPVVVVTDTAGRLVAGFEGRVTLAQIITRGGRSGLHPLPFTFAEQGIARFEDVVVAVSTDRGAVRLIAADGVGDVRAAPDTSDEIVLDVVATQLMFRTLPETVVSGLLSPAPVVVAVDPRGAVDADFQQPVELSMEASGDTLSGALVVMAAAGVATFRRAEFRPASPSPHVRLAAQSAGLPLVGSDSVSLRTEPTPRPTEVVLTDGPPLARPGRWVSVGPHAGGRIQALEAGPRGALYAGTHGAGVYRSTDAGATWRPMEGGLVNAVVNDVAAADDGDRVYAATDSGVYRSPEGDRPWVPVLRLPATGIAVHPHRSQTVFALAQGLRWSRDGGDTWEAVDLQRDGSAIACDPTASFVVTGRAVYTVSDTDVAFAHETGLPDGVRAVAVDPGDSRRVYAGTEDSVYLSQDGARTWSALVAAEWNGRSLGALALAADGASLYVGNGRGIYVSRDRGAIWTPVASFGNAPTNAQGVAESEIAHRVVSLAFGGGGSLVAGTEEGGVFRTVSADRWAASNAGLANVDVPSLVTDPRLPGVVFATGVGRVFRSENGGGSWRVVLHAHGRDDIVEGVVMSPGDPRILITTGISPMRISGDGGWSWTLLNPDYWFFRHLVFSPAEPNVMYARSPGGGVSYTADGGISWHTTPATPGSVRALTVSPDGRAIYLGTSRGLLWARAGDLDWALVSGGFPEGADVGALILDPRQSSALLAGTASGEVWRSTDRGGTWTLLGRPAREGQGIGAIAIDPEPTGGLYVGTEGAGVLVSADGGASWQAVNDGLASTSILTLAVDSASRRLYAGTARAGVFVTALADFPPSTAVVAHPEAGPHRLLIDKAYPNPFNTSIRVHFSIDAEGPVTLIVFNAIGQPIQRLVDGPLDAGPHTASWDGSDSSGRPVGTGTYFLRLRAASGERMAKLQLAR